MLYIIVILFRHTNALQTHTNKQTPTHTILAQPGMFASPCLHQVFTCVHQPFHLTWTSASSESDQDRTRIWSSAFLLWGIYNYSQYGVVQIRTDFTLNLGYVVAMCALPEYLLALFYYQISQGMICFVFFFFWAPAIIVKQISSQEKAVGWVLSTPCHHGVILIRISGRTRRGVGQLGTSHPTKTPTSVPCLLFPWFDCTISIFED